jgi:toxin HigB-1
MGCADCLRQGRLDGRRLRRTRPPRRAGEWSPEFPAPSLIRPSGRAFQCDDGGSFLVSRIDTRYAIEVILSFRHKGLEGLYRGGSKKGVESAHVQKLLRILSLLDVAQSPDDLAIPSFRTHPLKGDLAGHWSIWVSGNWRITFRFNETDVELVDYQDYH